MEAARPLLALRNLGIRVHAGLVRRLCAVGLVGTLGPGRQDSSEILWSGAYVERAQ